MIFIKSTFLSFTIWVVAALGNAILGGTWLTIFSNEFSHRPAAFFLAFIFTLVFSIPGQFIFWILLMVNRDDERLFRCMLKTGLIISVLSSQLLYLLPLDLVKGHQPFLSLLLVVSFIASIMIHHAAIKSISANKKLKIMYQVMVKLRANPLFSFTHNLSLPLRRFIRAPQKFQFTKDALHQLPEGTTWKEQITLPDRKKLQLLPYYAKPDTWHIQLQKDTTEEGEVCLQCFMPGNKHLSFPVVATVWYCLITMRGYWSKFGRAYQRGSRCRPIAGWQWFTLLHQPTQLLIQKINEN